MYATKNETESQTLTRLIRAMDHQFAVTVSYLKEEKDDTGRKTGALVETVRTLEIFDIKVTKAGDTLIVAMDRETRERRSFRADRITAYTLHRSARFTIPRPTADAPSGHGLAAATALLAPAANLPQPLTPASTEQRVNVLAGFLAAA
jgi:predicted DNA-binding transcriptional regulator YafY